MVGPQGVEYVLGGHRLARPQSARKTPRLLPWGAFGEASGWRYLGLGPWACSRTPTQTRSFITCVLQPCVRVAALCVEGVPSSTGITWRSRLRAMDAVNRNCRPQRQWRSGRSLMILPESGTWSTMMWTTIWLCGTQTPPFTILTFSMGYVAFCGERQHRRCVGAKLGCAELCTYLVAAAELRASVLLHGSGAAGVSLDHECGGGAVHARHHGTGTARAARTTYVGVICCEALLLNVLWAFACWCCGEQLVFATIVTLANATLLLKLQPYISNSDDTVSTLASWVTFFEVLCAPAFCLPFDEWPEPMRPVAWWLSFSPSS
jgi:hypothetical protein